MQEQWQIRWKDYYEVLGLHPSAEPEMIKTVYLMLVRKYNSDQNPSRTDSKWKSLNEAYEILGTPGKKRAYDLAYRENHEMPPPVYTSYQPPPEPVGFSVGSFHFSSADEMISAVRGLAVVAVALVLFIGGTVWVIVHHWGWFGEIALIFGIGFTIKAFNKR